MTRRRAIALALALAAVLVISTVPGRKPSRPDADAPAPPRAGDGEPTAAPPPAEAEAKGPAPAGTRDDEPTEVGPSLTGRVLGADGVPVRGTEVRLLFTDRAGRERRLATKAREDGRFHLDLPEERPVAAHLQVDALLGAVTIVRSLEPAALHDGLDLGDLYLPTVREVVLLVTDKAGAPLAHAVAGLPRVLIHDADAKGRIPLTLPVDEVGVRVGCVGRHSRLVEIPAGAPSPFPVRLEPAATLVIRPVEADGAIAEAVEVVVTSARPITESEDGSIDSLDLHSGATPPATGGSGSHYTFSWFPNDDGRVVLSRVRTDFPLSVEVLDRRGGPALARAKVSLGPGEWRDLPLTVSVPGRVVAGRVIGDGGEGLDGVVVRVSAGGNAWRYDGTTDDLGRFRIGGIRTERIRLRAERDDRLPEERALALPPEGLEVELVLRKGRQVSLEIVDEAGAPVRPDATWTEFEGERVAAAWDPSRQRARLGPLPAGPVTTSVRFAGRIFTLEHDARRPEARIVVPSTGEVRAVLPLTAEGRGWRVRLLPLDRRGAELTREIRPGTVRAGDEATFAHVLPGGYSLVLERPAEERDGTHLFDVVARSARFLVGAGEAVEVELGR